MSSKRKQKQEKRKRRKEKKTQENKRRAEPGYKEKQYRKKLIRTHGATGALLMLLEARKEETELKKKWEKMTMAQRLLHVHEHGMDKLAQVGLANK